MWKLKLKVYDETGTFAFLAKRYNVTIQGHMINYWSKKNYFYFTLAVFINAEEKIKKAILKDLKKIKRINKFEDQGNFILCEIKITESLEKERKPSLFYNPSLIQVKPFVVTPDGWEELEFASFERKPLEEILKISEKLYNLKLLYFKEEKIESFGVVNLFPELTERQKEVFNSAIEKGYYSYPRKVDVKRLAKNSKMSYSTFVEHLRRAEAKVLPFLRKKTKK